MLVQQDVALHETPRRAHGESRHPIVWAGQVWGAESLARGSYWPALNSGHIFVIVRKMSGSIGATNKNSRVSQRWKDRWIGCQLWLYQARRAPRSGRRSRL